MPCEGKIESRLAGVGGERKKKRGRGRRDERRGRGRSFSSRRDKGHPGTGREGARLRLPIREGTTCIHDRDERRASPVTQVGLHDGLDEGATSMA